MRRVLIAYALSGFVSLGYQVAWFRIFTDRFGSTNFTFALVVTCFIGGLAAGSASSRRLSRALSARIAGLRLYGAVETAVALSIGLTALTAAVPPDALGSFPYVLRDGIWELRAAQQALQSALAVACVLVPCFFMGVTYPLLCDSFRAHPAGPRFPAALYAWNTLGACMGVLACQFVLLPRIGHDATLVAMAGANALLGAWFLLAPGRPEAGGSPPHEPAPVELRATPAALVLLAGVSGLLAGALEADLFKRASFVIEVAPGATMSFVSFWAILAIFVASAAVRRLPRLPLLAIKVAFAAAAVYALLSWAGVDVIRDWVEVHVLGIPVAVESNFEGMRSLQFPGHLAQLWVFVGILVFPPYLAVSLLLPAVCNEIQRRGGHLGLAYGVNTLAFCTGFLAFMLVVPWLGNVFHAFKLFHVVFLLCAAWLFVLRERRPLAVWKPALLAAGLAAAWVLVPRDFDPGFFRDSSLPARKPVRAVRSNGAITTFVLDADGHPRLFFGRLLMSATHFRARSYMRLMAHFPLLLHPHPEKALLICLGVGNTGSAIAQHDGIRRIDVVDLNHQIFRTLPEFADVNASLHRDPRVRFIHDDGRSFLARTGERYDLVTSEPPPPLAAGVYRLYSTDYYRDVKAHLTPDGFMSQWLPLFLMTPESVEMAVSSFLEVFPHALLFTGFGTDLVLVGSPSPIELERLSPRLAESPEVAADLAVFNVRGPADLLARILQDDAALRANYAGSPTIEDERNDLEQQFFDPRQRAVARFEVASVLAALREQLADSDPALLARAESILTHLGRLQYHVQGFPYESLASVEPGAVPGLRGVEADWLAVSELHRENDEALRRGRTDRSMRVLERFLETFEEQPAVLLQLARMHLARGKPEQAVPLLDRFVALEPDDPLGHRMSAMALQRSGEPGRALARYREAARLDAGDWPSLAAMAWIHATAAAPELRDPGRALALAERARELAPVPGPVLLEALAAAHAASGNSQRAVELARQALDATPVDRPSERARRLRHLELYRAGQPLREPDAPG